MCEAATCRLHNAVQKYCLQAAAPEAGGSTSSSSRSSSTALFPPPPSQSLSRQLCPACAPTRALPNSRAAAAAPACCTTQGEVGQQVEVGWAASELLKARDPLLLQLAAQPMRRAGQPTAVATCCAMDARHTCPPACQPACQAACLPRCSRPPSPLPAVAPHLSAGTEWMRACTACSYSGSDWMVSTVTTSSLGGGGGGGGAVATGKGTGEGC